jgi:hypothetical protein
MEREGTMHDSQLRHCNLHMLLREGNDDDSAMCGLARSWENENPFGGYPVALGPFIRHAPEPIRMNWDQSDFWLVDFAHKMSQSRQKVVRSHHTPESVMKALRLQLSLTQVEYITR